MTDAPERTPRKDVARNRQRLLDAAKEVFAERGLDATLDDIARHAGVGAGTAYRHFGSRLEIIKAIFSDVAGTFISDARKAIAIDDPWEGLVTFVVTFAGRQAEDRGLHQVFTGNHGTALDPADWSALVETMSEVLDRAKAGGRVRDDVEFSDLVALFIMLGPVYDLSIATATPVWRRHVDMFLRGIRSEGAPSGIPFPSAMSTKQIDGTMTETPPPRA
jgi:AcrR family transcriptional regulator